MSSFEAGKRRAAIGGRSIAKHSVPYPLSIPQSFDARQENIDDGCRMAGVNTAHQFKYEI
jgi:hypothetical protein